jgi:hypothetical protein
MQISTTIIIIIIIIINVVFDSLLLKMSEGNLGMEIYVGSRPTSKLCHNSTR